MLSDWNILSEDLQLVLSRDALSVASAIIADQAETLAQEMETGTISDHGGANALRLLAALVRTHEPAQEGPVGHA
jgi:hypothetical protein